MNQLNPLVLLFILVCLINSCSEGQDNQEIRPRIVITADPELDDQNSLIRMLMYSTDLRIEGLIYASSGFHWKGDGKGTLWEQPNREYNRFGLDLCPCESWRWAEDERFIHDVVEAYEVVYPNLKTHNKAYPEPQLLKSKIRFGNIEFDGDISKDSPGSDLIKSLILDNIPGKLYITAWGGQSTIARSLKSIQQEFEKTPDWPRIREKINRKVVLLPSGDQDNTYQKYIQPNWPDIEYRQFQDGPNYSYGAQNNATPENSSYLASEWMKPNISDQGSLGELYRVWGDGKQMVEGDIFDYFGFSEYSDQELRDMGYIVWTPVQKKGSWLGEGDNPTFMNMLGNGLRAYEEGYFGGWGGRVVNKTDQARVETPSDSTSGNPSLQDIASSMNFMTNTEFPNFFPAAQNDFAARLKWSVTPIYEDANHEPSIEIEGEKSFKAAPRDLITLKAKISDPDRDSVNIKWWQFDGLGLPVIINPDDSSDEIEFQIPETAKSGDFIHIILEGRDNGVPNLTRYQRIVIEIE